MTLCALLCLALAPAAHAANTSQSAPGVDESDRIALNDPRIIGVFAAVTLDNDDTIRGTIIRVQDGVLVLRHEVLGDIEISTTRLIGVRRAGPQPRPRELPVPDPDAEPPTPIKPEIVLPEPTEPEVVEKPQVPEEAAKDESEAEWSSRVELGLSGSQGNAERMSVNAAFRTTRRTEGTRFSFDTSYLLNPPRGDRTANRLTLNARNDWNFPDSKWTLFLQGGAEFDEFRDFDVRTSAGAGFSYRFLDNDRTSLNARIGAGFSRDIGGTETEAVPELITGAELRHELTDRQTLAASAEVFPDLEELGEIRSILRARWEFRLDDKNDLALSLGLEQRFDSQADDDQRTDIDYFARLVFGF